MSPHRFKLQWPRTAALTLVTLGSIAAAAIAAMGEPGTTGSVALAAALVPSVAECAHAPASVTTGNARGADPWC